MTIIVRVNNLIFSLIGPHYSTFISSCEITFWCLSVYAKWKWQELKMAEEIMENTERHKDRRNALS